MGDRGEHVAADLGVIQLLVTPRQGAQRPYPGIRVDVLDLVIGERTSERPPDHRPSRALKLLVQARRSLPPCRRLLRRAGDRARGGDRGHTRLPPIRTPPSRRAPPVTASPPLGHRMSVSMQARAPNPRAGQKLQIARTGDPRHLSEPAHGPYISVTMSG